MTQQLETITEQSEREERLGRRTAGRLATYALFALLAVTSALGLTSCRSSEQGNQQGVSGPVRPGELGKEIDVVNQWKGDTTTSKGDFNYTHDIHQLIEDQKTLKTEWGGLGINGSVPDIDFTKYVIIEIYKSHHGSPSDLDLIEVFLRAEEIAVLYRFNIHPETILAPPRYLVLQIEKQDKPIVIYEQEYHINKLWKTNKIIPGDRHILNDLQARLKTNQNVYEVGESVKVDFRLKHVGEANIVVKVPPRGKIDPAYSIYLFCQDETGARLPIKHPVRDPRDTMPILSNTVDVGLSRNESHTNTFELNDWYDLSTAGTYHITGRYSLHMAEEAAGEYWTGTINSNTITIKVVK